MFQTWVLTKDAISKDSSSLASGAKSLRENNRERFRQTLYKLIDLITSLATTLPGQGLVNRVDFAHNPLHLLRTREVLNFLSKSLNFNNP